jgi:hypothetical protein
VSNPRADAAHASPIVHRIFQVDHAPGTLDFQFDMSLDAAQHNWWTFESFERILKKVIASDPNSMMTYGLEFTQHPRSNPGFAHYMVSVASLPKEGTTSSPPRTHGLLAVASDFALQQPPLKKPCQLRNTMVTALQNNHSTNVFWSQSQWWRCHRRLWISLQ